MGMAMSTGESTVAGDTNHVEWGDMETLIYHVCEMFDWDFDKKTGTLDTPRPERGRVKAERPKASHVQKMQSLQRRG